MKKTIAALAICLFAAGAAHAAMPQTPNTITPDLLAEATAKLNNPPAENPAGTEQQTRQRKTQPARSSRTPKRQKESRKPKAVIQLRQTAQHLSRELP